MPIFTRETITGEDLFCDVCIIGSGAGGATLAAGLVEQGLDVIMLEAGEYDTQKDFDMSESKAFQRRYQEKGLRATEDLSISVLQGRGVGGSTTVNWTSCFRTPKRILDIWRKRHGVDTLSEEILALILKQSKRLSIQTWSPELSARITVPSGKEQKTWMGGRATGPKCSGLYEFWLLRYGLSCECKTKCPHCFRMLQEGKVCMQIPKQISGRKNGKNNSYRSFRIERKQNI